MSLRSYIIIFLTSIGLLLSINFGTKRVYEQELSQLYTLSQFQSTTHTLVRRLAASSEDLTRLARYYVITLDSRASQEFELILLAREGEVPLKLSTVKQRYFWGQLNADDSLSAPQSIRQYLTSVPLLEAELSEFDRALTLSNRLSEIEKRAILLAPTDNAAAIDLIFGDQYFHTKERIFEHISNFSNQVDSRIEKQRQDAQDNLQLYRTVSWALSIALVLFFIKLIHFLYSSIIKPLYKLSDYAKTYSPDQQGNPLELQSNVVELQNLNRTINEMRLRISYDLIKTQQQIEELEITKKQAEAATEARGQFLANMSHEIRTPLNGITGFCHLLEATELSATQKNYTKLALRSADMLMTIINDILDWSKVDSGQSEPNYTEVNLADKIDLVVGITRFSAQEKSLQYTIEVEPSVPLYIHTDAARLRQILLNLLSNAIKFTQKGEITLRVSSLNDQVLFEVIDTGCGMDNIQISRVFDPFIQVDNSTTRAHGGTGLGLAISRKFARLLGGDITIDSHLNEGSRFKLLLPFAPNPLNKHTPLFFDLQIQKPLKVFISFDETQARQPALLKMLSQLNVRPSDYTDTDTEADLMILDSQGAKRLVQSSHHVTTPILYIGEVEAFELYRKQLSWERATLLAWPFTGKKLLDSIVEIQPSTSRAQVIKATDDSQNKYDLTVLVAEDVAINQLVIERMLANLGVKTVIVDDGNQALEAVKSQHIDLIFMDLHMPTLDGYQAAEALKAQPSYQHIPIVALSADVQESAKQRCDQIGFSGYMLKPFSPTDIKKELDKHVIAITSRSD